VASLDDLIAAIVADDAAAVSRLLSTSPSLALAHQVGGDRILHEIEHYLYGGDTALHIAAAAYRASMIQELLASGADVNARNRRGAEPLHYAADGIPGASTWNPEAQRGAIQALLQAGADPNALDKNGVAPLHRAVRTRCSAAVEALIEGGADTSLPNKRGSTARDLATRTTGRGGSGSPAAKAEQQQILRVLAA
jgi:hypothetical protein